MGKIKELKYYGIHACSTLFKKRPQDIIRVYLDESNVRAFSPLLKWCAQNRKAYHIIPENELNQVSDSIHHEGICVLAKERLIISVAECLADLKKQTQPVCLLYLDGVENPHNLGSILRTSAHFGVPYILGANLPSLSASACRIAKGGAEFVRLVALPKPLETLRYLQQIGYGLIATSAHKGKSLYQFSFPAKAILAIGSESKGVSAPFLKSASESIRIPGTGAMESLNVAVATGLCLGEFSRQHL